MELMPASFREWTDILARIRFGKVRAAGKNITGASLKAVAGRLATYADSNGTRVRPGIARVAVDLEMDARTVKTAIAHLRAIGLLKLVRAGGRRGADEYRLTLPTDLLDRDDLTVWSPSEQRAEIERVADSRRGTPPNGPNGGGSRGPQAPVIAPESRGPVAPMKDESQGPVAPHKAPSGDPIAGASGAQKSPIMGACGAQSRGPVAPATDQYLDTTTTDHADGDLRTDVTGPGAPSAEPTNPEPSTRPAKCPTHGLGGGLRPDGQPECTLCRVTQRLTRPPEPEPPRPPPTRAPVCPYGVPLTDAACRCGPCLLDAKQGIAPVIRLDTRRTA